MLGGSSYISLESTVMSHLTLLVNASTIPTGYMVTPEQHMTGPKTHPSCPHWEACSTKCLQSLLSAYLVFSIPENTEGTLSETQSLFLQHKYCVSYKTEKQSNCSLILYLFSMAELIKFCSVTYLQATGLVNKCLLSVSCLSIKIDYEGLTLFVTLFT
jgi:hypothetical protein